jgi:hypothetical protein
VAVAMAEIDSATAEKIESADPCSSPLLLFLTRDRGDISPMTLNGVVSECQQDTLLRCKG